MVVPVQGQAFGELGEDGDAEVRKRVEEARNIESELDEKTLLGPWLATWREITDRLPERLSQVRTKGYRFTAGIEDGLAALKRRGEDIQRSVEEDARERRKSLAWRLEDFRRQVALTPGLVAASDPGWLARCDLMLDEMRDESRKIKQGVQDALGDVPAKVSGINARLTNIELSLRRLAEASFRIDPSAETLFVAVEAEWKKGGSAKENPDGVLFVTDRRIIMERKEKEGGFLGFGGKKVQGLLWEVPWGEVEAITPEKKGLMGGVDLIQIRPGAGAGFEPLTVEIKGHLDAHDFAASLQPALDGSLAQMRRDGS